jgi:hypothetical protein
MVVGGSQLFIKVGKCYSFMCEFWIVPSVSASVKCACNICAVSEDQLGAVAVLLRRFKTFWTFVNKETTWGVSPAIKGHMPCFKKGEMPHHGNHTFIRIWSENIIHECSLLILKYSRISDTHIFTEEIWLNHATEVRLEICCCTWSKTDPGKCEISRETFGRRTCYYEKGNWILWGSYSNPE